MCLSLCSRLCHWGPLVALGIIKWVSLATVYSNTMYWPVSAGWGGIVNMLSFLFFSSLTTFHFFCAMCDGPGYLPLEWKPDNEKESQYLQFCDTCQGYKAPRAHHCRKCGRCVMKMDHHCPWINNCVGHFNHGHFVAFLTFAVLGCAQASFVLAMTLYYGLNRSWYHYYGTGDEPKITLTLTTLLVVMFALGLAIGVVLAVGALLYFQMRSIWRNQTGIEDWILEKAYYRRKDTDQIFHHPYDMGRSKNLQEVITWTCIPSGDGIEWSLREDSDCNKYTLTIEQLEQKAEKRLRTREYKIAKVYSGSWLPFWSMGCKVASRPPCTDEPRIQLKLGDTVKVTRWKKFWLYGDKVNCEERMRGWFPRKCAIEFIDNGRVKESKKSR